MFVQLFDNSVKLFVIINFCLGRDYIVLVIIRVIEVKLRLIIVAK